MKGIRKNLTSYLMRFLSIAGVCTALSEASFPLLNFWTHELPESAPEVTFDPQRCGKNLCATASLSSFYKHGFLYNSHIDKTGLNRHILLGVGTFLRALQLEGIQSISDDIKSRKNSFWIHNFWPVALTTACGAWLGPFVLKNCKEKGLNTAIFDCLVVGAFSIPQFFRTYGLSLPPFSWWGFCKFAASTLCQFFSEDELFGDIFSQHLPTKNAVGASLGKVAGRGCFSMVRDWLRFSGDEETGIFQDGQVTHARISKGRLLLSFIIPGLSYLAYLLFPTIQGLGQKSFDILRTPSRWMNDFTAPMRRHEGKANGIVLANNNDDQNNRQKEGDIEKDVIIRDSLENVLLDCLKKFSDTKDGFFAYHDIPQRANDCFKWMTYPNIWRSCALTGISLSPLVSSCLTFSSDILIRLWLCLSNIYPTFQEQVPQVVSGNYTTGQVFKESLSRVIILSFFKTQDLLKRSNLTWGNIKSCANTVSNMAAGYKDTVVSAVQSVASFFSSSN